MSGAASTSLDHRNPHPDGCRKSGNKNFELHFRVAMNILGINAYHGNASAAIVCDGKLIAAVEEERFNRVKYAAGFPSAAIRYCLEEAGLRLSDIDHVAVPRNPFARLGTKLWYAVRMPSFARERARVITKF